ncbi:hypothetical protein R3W88_020248 [Solanum pinnatisectum]|uniref:Uncharacterized protein n=1 Tax=Solanum pinnatisectum TaxID=50273 RepID=A0AAV9KLK5_9SOLN|nr:hypothetical protein R3W88_020248 [Solanum pinnatisectum]
MFNLLFGWRKASKCKNLIRRVQRRIKLLKNKRSCIIKQLKDDLSELLRNGHYEIVIDRVEQLSLDERKVALYDLLENYCEFIMINLPCIRKHKECPDDINEAVSSLIFASARLGDLPELAAIRKFFSERYGQGFEKSALQLLPGNVVSYQIMDYICISSVSEEEKYRLVDEIARSCYQQGPLLLEYRRESPDELVNETSNAASDYMDPLIDDPSDSHQQLLPTANSTRSSTTKSCKDSVNSLKDNRNEFTRREKSNINDFISEKNVERRAAESSTEEDSALLPEQMIYLDDIQEFESAVKKDVNFEDQRLFMFKAPFVPSLLKIDTRSKFDGIEKKFESQNAKERSKVSRKNRTISGKRTRRKSGLIVSDIDSTIYYGDLSECSPDSKPKRQNRRSSTRKSSVKENKISYHTFAHDTKDQHCYVKFRSTMTFVKCMDDHSSYNGTMENHCSLEHPCYYWITDKKGNVESPLRVPRRRVKSTKNYNNQDQNVESMKEHYVKHDTEEVSRSQETCDSTMSSTSRMTYQRARDENQAPYLRAMTMPIERPKDCLVDNFLRSSSFPVQEAGNGSYENRHVHPKLPNYDEIEATFLALKKEKLLA